MNRKIKGAGLSLVISGLLLGNNAFAAETPKIITGPSDPKSFAKVLFHIDNLEYTIGDEVKKVDVAPYIKEGRTMLSLRYVAEALGIGENEITWEPETKTVTVFKENKIIQMKIDSDTIAVDGKKIIMDTVAEIKDGRTMLPLRYLAEALDTNIEWDGANRTVTITTEEEIVDEPVASNYDYSYDGLVEKATAYSKDLKSAKGNLEKLDILRDDAGEAVKYGSSHDASGTNAVKSLKSAEIQLQMGKREITTTEESIAYSVKSAYYTVLESIGQEKIAALSKEVAKKSLDIANNKYEQGIISSLEQKQAERSYETSKKTYDLAVKTTNNNYEKLNLLVGFDSNERYTLDDTLSFEKNREDDVELHIQKILQSSPTIWSLEKQVYLAQLGLDLYVYNSGSDSYDVKKIDLNKAEITLDATKEQTAQSMRNLDNQMKQLEDQYENQLIKLDQAKEDLATAQLNLEMGTGIAIDVEKAKLSLEQAKENLQQTRMSYDKLWMSYDKPWAAGN